jgi:hypothetical protein
MDPGEAESARKRTKLVLHLTRACTVTKVKVFLNRHIEADCPLKGEKKLKRDRSAYAAAIDGKNTHSSRGRLYSYADVAFVFTERTLNKFVQMDVLVRVLP